MFQSLDQPCSLQEAIPEVPFVTVSHHPRISFGLINRLMSGNPLNFISASHRRSKVLCLVKHLNMTFHQCFKSGDLGTQIN